MPPRPAGHHGENPSETIARFIVERALGVRVCSYDDRRGTSRPDAIIHRNGGVPLEIVSDPNKAETQLATALDKIDRRMTVSGLAHGYWVSLTAKARVKDLGWLEDTLRQLEDPAQSEQVPRRTDAYEFIALQDRFAPGEVRFSIGSGGGHPIPSGSEAIAAATTVLSRPGYADVPRKLNAYGGAERHALLSVDSENDPTFNWLREATPDDLDGLPTPQLDPGVTDLWLTPRYLPGLTIHWSASTDWQGTQWEWGRPIEVLDGWDDPICPEDHTPN